MGKEQANQYTGEIKPNRIRQAQNLAIFNGVWHGTYYENGIPNPGGVRISEDIKMISGKEYLIKKPSKKN